MRQRRRIHVGYLGADPGPGQGVPWTLVVVGGLVLAIMQWPQVFGFPAKGG